VRKFRKNIIGNWRNHKKNHSGDQINSDEINLIKKWIIGDAIAYERMENNFQDWISEYERLLKCLIVYENKDCSSAELLEAYGILEDAERVCYDIANYLEKKR
jgi:hypothetical protein